MNQLIETIKTYIDLSADEAILIRSLFTEMRLEAGAYFLEEGKVCRHVAFINQGLMRYFISPGANRIIRYQF
jgi:hypothetical protein